ncbi:hypothetical protein O6H91_10G110100 [Diphasiastrum complanatum]|uniref:Uncharacterized protein n=1 Tax=Diphasiastrum complanatum TaxID=34168 RepID=A0ACC2CKP1_DIPCM|nr:hypothetical protein O6H91_10G110100 [Diphasiastrum complanatum]
MGNDMVEEDDFGLQDKQQQQQHDDGWEDSQFRDGVRSGTEAGEGGDSSASGKQKAGGSFWGWGNQNLGVNRFDEGKKQTALAACATEHEALINCLGKGAFVNCSSLQRSFWDCYAKNRGVRGNKIAAWFAAPTLSGQHGARKEADGAGKNREANSSEVRDGGTDR